MYKNFIKTVEQTLVSKLEKYNFKYLKKEEQFVGFFDELVFRVSFDTAGYGSRVEVHLEYDFPIIKEKLKILPKHFMRYGYLAKNENWNLEEVNKEDFKEYLSEIIFLFKNYFYYLLSKDINSFELEKYIKEEYYVSYLKYIEETGGENPADDYILYFLSSGKSQDEWTEADDEKCNELIKQYQDKYFPYEKIKKDMLDNIKKNRPIYKMMISDLFGANANPLKYDNDILPTTLEELFSDGQVTKALKDLGFVRKYNINTQGRSNYGETYYFDKDDIELLVILKDELFLEFIVNRSERSKRINIYNGGYFWFGWLVGKPNVIKENINEALKHLTLVLSEIECSGKGGVKG